jgi:hypothetical protein
MSGVTVTVISRATNQARVTTTNETGNYSGPFLVPGLYDVRAEISGFKAGWRRGVDLEVGAVARMNFTMEIGEVSQQVEISSMALLSVVQSCVIGSSSSRTSRRPGIARRSSERLLSPPTGCVQATLRVLVSAG